MSAWSIIVPGSTPSDCVDVVVTQGDASLEIVNVTRESARRGGFARLLIDSFGMPPPFATLAAAADSAGWHEMLINLAVGGMFRIGRAAFTDTASSAADAALMDRLFGGVSWRDSFDGNRSWSNDTLERLARTYAECFSKTHGVREVYRLFSSDNQVHFMVHLAYHEKCAD